MKNPFSFLAPAAVLAGGAALLTGLTGLASCTTDASSRSGEVGESSSNQCKSSELHVFGSYEARSSGAPDPSKPWPPPHVQRDSYIRIDRPGEHKIVLSAYEPMKWHVSAAPGAEITHVLVNGYHAQEVVLDGIKPKVEIESYEQGGGSYYGREWEEGAACQPDSLCSWVKAKTGEAATSYHGCYQVDRWTLNADLSTTSSCNSDGGGYQLEEWSVKAPPSGDCPGDPSGAEVQVVGVYETRSDHGGGSHPVGVGRVKVERPGDQILVVSSYEPTEWQIEVAPGVNLVAVYAAGYHRQSVKLPEGSNAKVKAVSAEAGETSVACGYRLPSEPRGCQTEQLLQWAEDETGIAPTSFRGCYRATRWTIGKGLETTADCNGELTEKIFDEK